MNEVSTRLLAGSAVLGCLLALLHIRRQQTQIRLLTAQVQALGFGRAGGPGFPFGGLVVRT